MYTVLIVLIIITAVLLMLVVLAQNPKGGGLSSQFGGSGTTQLMGVKKTGDFLEKATWTLAILLISLTLVANVMVPDTTRRNSTPNLENAGQQPSTIPVAPSSSDDQQAVDDLVEESTTDSVE
jgi:preprotein translocase subunit SecG